MKCFSVPLRHEETATGEFRIGLEMADQMTWTATSAMRRMIDDMMAVAIEAGRIMLERLDEPGRQNADFAFETTLASRSFARRLTQLQQAGYRTHLLFLWLPSPEMSMARVASRVQRGGHHVPDDVVRRRYDAGLRNFFAMYRPIIDAWRMFDNSDRDGYELIAQETSNTGLQVEDPAIWKTIEEQYR